MRQHDEAEVRRTYDRVADVYADHFRSTESEQPIELAMVEHFVRLLPPTREVLDAGCGAGRMMPLLHDLGCRVHGVDLSAGMIRRARADHPQFDTQVASLTALPHRDHVLDGVFSWYSTIHSPDDTVRVMLREAHRVLRPGGLLLLAFQTGDDVREVGQAFRDRGHDVTLWRHHRSVEHLRRELQAAGFQVVAALDRAAHAPEPTGQGVLIAQVG